MRQKYIVAVSGGVDSVVLLHKLMAVKSPHIDYVVAHFDHGIRKDSAKDAQFVEKLADNYELQYVAERVELGEKASEDEARSRRYDFLRKVKKKFKAEGIITAHHQDDVLETMIANMLRGTGPRGLVGFSASDIVRPFMNKTKSELLAYAKKHKLEWREDSTNQDERYFRNYIRRKLMPKLKAQDRKKLLAIREQLLETYVEIDSLTKKLLVQVMEKGEINRALFVVLPFNVQKEIMATALQLEGVELDKQLVEKATIAAKTLPIEKHVELKKDVTLYSKNKRVLLKVDRVAPSQNLHS